MASTATPNYTQRVATLPDSSSPSSTIRIGYTDCPSNPSIGQKGTILLIHGWPQTSYQFRHVTGPFSDAGYRLIVPDYRSAGQSSKPVLGYEKSVMATELLTLIRSHLGIKEKIHVIGHDIGGMIAYAYASRHPEFVKSVVWGECPLPGTSLYEEVKSSTDVFHFVFHRVPDLPEALIAGRESIYLKHFFDKQSYNTAWIEESLDVYTRAFEQPGAMRAGINIYRAFERDAEENRKWVKENGKCKVPALALSGGEFLLAEKAEGMFREVHENVKTAVVKESGHYVAEENPGEFVKIVLDFIERVD